MRFMGEMTGQWYDVQPRPELLGGQAVVRSAFDERGRRFAVKLARLDIGPIDDVWLELEARLVANLIRRDPGLVDVVVPVIDRAIVDGRRVLVMPWIERRLDEAAEMSSFLTRLELAATFARSVARLQRTGIVHRDIKPANALVERQSKTDPSSRGRARSDLRVFLTDLGGAWRDEAEVGPSGAVFTGDYAPIDQRLASAEDAVDPSWDVHAAAASVFEVLTGTRLASVRAASGQLTARGREALTLPSAARRPTPLHHLVHVRRLRPMLAEDLAALRRVVTEAAEDLRLGRARRYRLAEEAFTGLRAALSSALSPIPGARPSDAGVLAEALEDIRERWADERRHAQRPVSESETNWFRIVTLSLLLVEALLMFVYLDAAAGFDTSARRAVHVVTDVPPGMTYEMGLEGASGPHPDGRFERVRLGAQRLWIHVPECPFWRDDVVVTEGRGPQTIEVAPWEACRRGRPR